MKTMKYLFALATVAAPLVIALPAQAGVEVTFTNPEKFTDAYPHSYGVKERDDVLKKLAKHMEGLGDRYLKSGQTLKIEVLDLDLAGRVEWWHPNGYDIRYMRDIDAPAMKVRYTLEENGAPLASGEERIVDLSYLMNLTVFNTSNDSLTYEKTMLDNWFRKRFGKAPHS